MGTIMDRNSKNLTEAKEINKRWQRKKNKKKRRGGKNTQKNCTKILKTWIITMVWSLTKSQIS